jgi:predicted DNA-binding protein
VKASLVEQLEQDIQTLKDFYFAYLRFDDALENLKAGRSAYPSELVSRYDIALKVLNTHRLEAQKVADRVRQNQEVSHAG